VCTLHIYLLAFLRIILSILRHIIVIYSSIQILFDTQNICAFIWYYLVLFVERFPTLQTCTLHGIFLIFENRISRGISLILQHFYSQRLEFHVAAELVQFEPLGALYFVPKHHHKLEGVVQEWWTSHGVFMLLFVLIFWLFWWWIYLLWHVPVMCMKHNDQVRYLDFDLVCWMCCELCCLDERWNVVRRRSCHSSKQNQASNIKLPVSSKQTIKQAIDKYRYA